MHRGDVHLLLDPSGGLRVLLEIAILAGLIRMPYQFVALPIRSPTNSSCETSPDEFVVL